MQHKTNPEPTFENHFFPHEIVRPSQDKMIDGINSALENGKHILIHAPTGIGKTAAALSTALSHARKNNQTVFFLTSRHTQHHIAIETLSQIKQRNENSAKELIVADLIGKKHMCAQLGADVLNTGEFHEFCKALVEGKTCEFYSNTHSGKKLTPQAQNLLSQITENPTEVTSAASITEQAKEQKVCPYEIGISLAAKANIIITDYYYLLNPSIRDGFLKRTGKDIKQSILIFDEAHNLPGRCRELMTSQLSSFTLRSALKEAKKFAHTSVIAQINAIQDVLLDITTEFKMGQETLIRKETFNDMLMVQLAKVAKTQASDQPTGQSLSKDNAFGNASDNVSGNVSGNASGNSVIAPDYEMLIADLQFAGEAVLQTQHRSFIMSIATFLESWNGGDEGFTRIVALKEGRREQLIVLSYKCLDPSLLMKDLIDDVPSMMLMSGTLLPVEMYHDVLGFENERCELLQLESPFPKENRLNLIIPKTSTKYETRGERTFQEIAHIVSELVNSVPGNSAVFFPSYSLRDAIHKYLDLAFRKSAEKPKPVLKELAQMGNAEKKELIERFKSFSKTKQGGVLLAVSSGNFGEGIDLPGDLLKAVIVVGLPLAPPDLETRQLISYYDYRFQKGWDYGYVMPAFIKTLQNAGRCIRSETDRGLIAFIDERYTQESYYRLFPKDWHMRIAHDYRKGVEAFFKVR